MRSGLSRGRRLRAFSATVAAVFFVMLVRRLGRFGADTTTPDRTTGRELPLMSPSSSSRPRRLRRPISCVRESRGRRQGYRQALCRARRSGLGRRPRRVQRAPRREGAAGGLHRPRQEHRSGCPRGRPRPARDERRLRRGRRLQADRAGEGPAVVRIAPVGNYEIDLRRRCPTSARRRCKQKITGKGIKVAVIDSGIDYPHKALGGSGNPAEYAANNPDDHRARHVPHEEGRGRLRLRRRHTGPGNRHRPRRPILIRSTTARRIRQRRRGPRDARRAHHRRQGRRRTRRRPLRRQGLLVGLHLLLRHRADPGHGVRPRPERRRQGQGPRRHHQHVARLALRAAVRRRPVRWRSTTRPSSAR